MFDWFWGLFKKEKKDAPCLQCSKEFPKETMTELIYGFKNEDGTEGTASAYLCEPCRLKIAKEIEDEFYQDEIDFSGKEFEVDDRL